MAWYLIQEKACGQEAIPARLWLQGNVEGSLLIERIRSTDPDVRMPPIESLTTDETSLLEQWIQRGAPDPRTPDAPSSNWDDPSDPVAGRRHWAFQPLSQSQPPTVNDENWPQSDTDRFVLAGLENSNLKPSPDADRVTLMRRAYFVLTGMPPTIEQTAAFINDNQPDAYERLVDQLLASPHFGERWGRHWLDLARYADSNGMDENFLFREAWRYRNWVINAVNEDVPLDRFLLEQIAGDLLPFDTTEQRDQQRIAAGFMVVGPKVLLGNDPNERIMDVADEQLNTIGRAVLGQTLGCARCHDHKFDPIPTADYYAMAGILTSTSVLEQRYMLGQQRVMEQLIGLGEDGADLDNAYEKYWRELASLKKKQDLAKQALKFLTDDNLPGFDDLAKKHADAIAEGAADSARSREERIELQKTFSESVDHAVANPPAIPPRAMTPTDKDKPTDEAIRLAGKFTDKGEVVPRGFLQVVSRTPANLPTDGSGRVELAQWLTRCRHWRRSPGRSSSGQSYLVPRHRSRHRADRRQLRSHGRNAIESGIARPSGRPADRIGLVKKITYSQPDA